MTPAGQSSDLRSTNSYSWVRASNRAESDVRTFADRAVARINVTRRWGNRVTLDVPRGGRVLFIGDSITDAGRDRSRADSLGCGYALMASAWFGAEYPDRRVTFLNTGISGNRVRDLRARWRSDCLDLAPNVVSVLIGVNDTWRRYSDADPTPVEDFERDYRHILELTRDRLGAGLVLIEPFLIPLSADQHRWREDLDPKVEVVRKLAGEFGATLVAVQAAFAATGAPPTAWTNDGVHLTPAGHALLAREWLRAVVPTTRI